MKIKNLLISCVALLGAGAANAEVVDGVRQAPKMPVFEAEAQEVQYGRETGMYMYNKSANMFFLGANDWGTRASVGYKGFKVYIEKFENDTTVWDGKTVHLTDSVETRDGNIMHTVFADGGGMWVDNNTDENNRFTLTDMGNKVYRLSPSDANPNANYTATANPDLWMGAVNAHLGKDTRLYWNLPATEASSQLDWVFFTVEAYEAGLENYTAKTAEYDSLLSVYNVAQSLKAEIDKAAGLGIDVAAWTAVYVDETTTVADLEKATAAAKEAVQKVELEKAMNAASVANPIDLTNTLINNPGYDGGSNTGWSGTAPGFGNEVAEFYWKTYDHYQDIANVPEGVFAVGIQGFYRAGWTAGSHTHYLEGTAQNAQLYAKVGNDTLTANLHNASAFARQEKIGTGNEISVTENDLPPFIPNDMSAAAAYFGAGDYTGNTLVFGVNDGAMRIGLMKSKTLDGDWTLFDNWTLIYYGKGADAYQKWLDDVVKNAPVFAEDVVATDGMLEAYNALVASYTQASTHDEVVAAAAAINGAATALSANIALWADYSAKVNEGLALAAREDLNGIYVDELADYCELEAEEIIAAMELTTEELAAEVAKLEEMMEMAKKHSYSEGSDVTDLFLVNADFSQGEGQDVPGWKGKWGNVSSKCMEAWNMSAFDAYQEVIGAGVGIYEVSLQGFYRKERGQNAYNLYVDGGQTCPASVYVNNNKTGLKCVFDEPVAYNTLYSGSQVWYEEGDGDPTYWYPDGMISAGEAFVAGMYQAAANGLVAKDGDVLRLGIKGEIPGDTWVIWDNFRMIYWGKRADKVQPYLQEAIAAGEANLQNAMAKDVRATVEAAVEGGKAVVDGTDGSAMFDALVALYASNDSVEASVALFAELETAASDLYVLITNSETDKAVIDEASLLAGEAMDAAGTSSVTNAEARKMLADIALISVKLKLPASAVMNAATDDNVVDITAAISSADFGNVEGTNTDKGWSYTAQGSFGNDDTQKAAFAYEYYQKAFDLYQELPGLPAGTYTLTVDGFSRNGTTDNDYKLWTAGEVANTTYLYAMTTDSVVYREASVAYYSSGISEVNNGFGGEGEFIPEGGTAVYLPGSVVSAVNYMDELGKYKDNKVVITIAEGQTLRIGMKKAEYISNDWVIMDNWQLFYHGTNSTAEGIEEVAVPSQAAVVKTEVYSISGAQMNGLQKGLNIVKRTLEDGTVIVKKLFVK